MIKLTDRGPAQMCEREPHTLQGFPSRVTRDLLAWTRLRRCDAAIPAARGALRRGGMRWPGGAQRHGVLARTISSEELTSALEEWEQVTVWLTMLAKLPQSRPHARW